MKKLFLVFKDAALKLYKNNPLRLSAATAFFSIFALPPIIIILSNVLGFFSRRDITNDIFIKLEDIIGAETARSLKNIPGNFAFTENGMLYTIGSVIFFIFVATNLFRIIQQSLNEIYAVKEKNRPLVAGLIDRAIGFAFIMITGLLFLATLLVDTALVFIGSHLHNWIPSQEIILIKTGNVIAAFFLAFVWFAVILKLLPALRIHWKAIFAGSLVSTALFIAGKYVLNWLLNGRIKTIYEASASAVLLLIFIFYISLIIYYGACFTISFASAYGLKMKPKRFAMFDTE